MKGDKKGQELTLGTIILIVLGVVVLIFLIYGFSTGWGNLWQRVTGLGGGKVNVDTIRTACVLACEQGNSYAFCTQERSVVFNEKDDAITTTCNELVTGDQGKKIPAGVASPCNKFNC
ncbi:MAG: hypothetical protein WC494_02990 [Candidatus Pacearchaeota archaeon]